MKSYRLGTLVVAIGAATIAATAAPVTAFEWQVVVNNGDFMPTDLCDPANPPTPPGPTCRKFNSYNQPSVNAAQLVVIRARSKGGQGGGQPVHGVYTRDMAAAGPVVRILDRSTLVPEPNNLDSTFIEPPSFPRIDIGTDTVATRGNHQPVWIYSIGTDPVTGEPITTRAGTTGIYTNPFGDLITGASKLGAVPEFSFFEVPEAPGTPFDVFPGAPAVTDGATIAFKGNYPVDDPPRTTRSHHRQDRRLLPRPRGRVDSLIGGRPHTRGRHRPRGVDRQQRRHPHPRHRHGLRLHRAAQRGQPPDGVRRLRQRGKPQPSAASTWLR